MSQLQIVELRALKSTVLGPDPDHFLFFSDPGLKVNIFRDFCGGTIVKNPPANAGDMGSSPGPGRSHMPWSN